MASTQVSSPLAFRLLRALRAFSFPLSALAVLTATAVALPVPQWRWDVLAASLVGAVALHAVGNLCNDYFDFRLGVDRLSDDPGRPGRLLVRGELTLRAVGLLALTAGLTACLAAGYVVGQIGPGVLAFAAVGAVGALAYTAPPWKLKHRAMGEAVVFVVFGPALMAGAAWAQTGRLSPAALLVSIPAGLATAAVLAGNNLRDRDEDAAAGVWTVAQMGQGRLGRWVYLLLPAVAVAVTAVLAWIGFLRPMLLGAPALLLLLAQPAGQIWHGRRVVDVDRRTALFASVLLACLFAGCVRMG